MTLDWRKYWWQPGFVPAFFAVDVPYWLFPYNKLNLPDALPGAERVVVFAVAALARVTSGKSFLRVAMVMGSAVPAVVMARVVVSVPQFIVAMVASGIAKKRAPPDEPAP
jgi:hypothetical protein